MKQMKQSLIRRWVGGTNRDSHLKLNFWITVTLIGYAVTQSKALGGNGDALWWLGVAITCRSTELLISPDVDQANSWGAKRGFIFYRIWWSLFGSFTPHRSRFSHSLLFGLPCRLMWALMPIFLIAFGALQFELLSSDQIQDFLFLIELNNVHMMILVGAIISDFFHLVLDDYGLLEIIFGKLE